MRQIILLHLATASDLCCSDGDERVREAAVWAIINLTWSRDGDAEETAARVQQLRLLGVEEQLKRWGTCAACCGWV